MRLRKILSVAAGNYDGKDPRNYAGHTLHGDHAYCFYQITKKCQKNFLNLLARLGGSQPSR